jgi:dTDP-4-dehydrorhamnose 3,5-epimerase
MSALSSTLNKRATDSYCRPGSLDGVLIFERPTHADERGFFHEAFRLQDLERELRRSVTFVQVNHSRSRKDVLRGLHAEDWAKLIYVPFGDVFTAIADLRPWSSTFGRTETFSFSDHCRPTVYLPAGLAHGYCVQSDMADYVYQVTDYYDGSDIRAVAWDDPDLAIPWPTAHPLLSDKDRKNPTFRELVARSFPQVDAGLHVAARAEPRLALLGAQSPRQIRA